MNCNSIAPVILSAGKIDETLRPIIGEINTGLIPIKGKPSIFYIIDKYIEMGFKNVYITVGFQKDRLIRITSEAYRNKIDIKYISVDYNKKPGTAIIDVVKVINENNIFITLSDTIADYNFNEMFHGDASVLLGEMESSFYSRYWSKAIIKNGCISSVLEKHESNENAYPIAGVYYFENIKNIIDYIDNEDLEITEIIKVYLYKNLKVRFVKSIRWLDVSHIFSYYKSKKEMISSRYFNSFDYNDILGTVIKYSQDKNKLRNEILWYLNVPKEIRAIIPKIIDYSIDGNVFVEMEYYGYTSLSELFVYGDLTDEIWKNIIYKLFKIIELFKRYKGDVTVEDYESIYAEKTFERIEDLKKDEFFQEMILYNEFYINKKRFLGWKWFKDKIINKIKDLYCPDDNCIIHGDFCFSNILFDINNGIIRIIDPRGSFGNNLIYGDIKYDVAKLRHSICGKYDLIINDLFYYELKENNLTLNFNLVNDNLIRLEEYFDEILEENGFNVNDIKFIEALLFISMIPLHRDKPNRQVVMFARGIELLNEVFNK